MSDIQNVRGSLGTGSVKKKATRAFSTPEPRFDPALNMLQPPMEITRSMIRVLRMIDESVIVHGRPPAAETESGRAADMKASAAALDHNGGGDE